MVLMRLSNGFSGVRELASFETAAAIDEGPTLGCFRMDGTILERPRFRSVVDSDLPICN